MQQSEEVKALVSRVEALEKQYTMLARDLEENTRVTKEAKFSVDRMYEWFDAAEGAFKVLDALGKLAKPLAAMAGLAAGVATAWAVVTGRK